MDTKELLKKVRTLEIKTKGLTNHIFAGEYHSAFKGRGMSFSEVREYQYGDDVRNIDWNVTARFDHPYIKVFEEERELTFMLMVDVSGSSQFGSQNQTKREMMTEISAILAFSAIKNNDKVGLILFSDQIEKYIPPKKGRPHILRIIRELIDFKSAGKGTDIKEAFTFFNHVVKKKAIVFCLSDFMDGDYKKPLGVMAKRHDVVGIRTFDPLEDRWPAKGMAKLRDLETGQWFWADTGSKKFKKALEGQFHTRGNYFKETFQSCGAGQIELSTKSSHVQELIKFFKSR